MWVRLPGEGGPWEAGPSVFHAPERGYRDVGARRDLPFNMLPIDKLVKTN